LTVTYRRLTALVVALMLGFGAIIVRLVFVQVLAAERYAALGVSERLHSVTLPADRGSIFDRDGRELAITVPQYTVWADPRLVTDPVGESRALAPVLGVDDGILDDRLSARGYFVYLARKVDDATATRVRQMKLPGVNLLVEPKRFSPAGALAGPLLGTVGTDNEGLSGLEVRYDSVLTGKPGRLVVEQDASGQPIAGGVHRVTAAARGSDLVLTIDRSLEYEVERDLGAEIVAAHARGGMAAVMDTHTGDVLAMASLVAAGQAPPPPSAPAAPSASSTPASDASTVPAAPPPGTVAAPSNSVVTTVYEPGSVNKIVTISAALQERLVVPGDALDVADSIHVGDTWFTDHDPHPVRHWTVTDILTSSSNVGTITLAQRLGKQRLDAYLRRFGFGARTALRLPGESAGLLLDPRRWYSTSIATVPLGQGVATTAVQILAAMNTLANGGVYVAPRLVKAVIDPLGHTVAAPPSPSHPVLSPTVAREMTAMLTEVVRTGTATAAAIDGYTVAGKTGTARKTVEGVKGYKPGAYISTFAGFVPAESPAFTAMVVLDEPTPIYGGLVAAPVFAEFSRYALRELHIPPPPPDAAMFGGVPRASPTGAVVVGEPGGDIAPAQQPPRR